MLEFYFVAGTLFPQYLPSPSLLHPCRNGSKSRHSFRRSHAFPPFLHSFRRSHGAMFCAFPAYSACRGDTVAAVLFHSFVRSRAFPPFLHSFRRSHGAMFCASPAYSACRGDTVAAVLFYPFRRSHAFPPFSHSFRRSHRSGCMKFRQFQKIVHRNV